MVEVKRKIPIMNSYSMACIALLLLIFFLLITSMDTDRRSAQPLPALSEKHNMNFSDNVKDRNILEVYLNQDNSLVCGSVGRISLYNLKAKAKDFIANTSGSNRLPEMTQKNVDFFGTTMVSDKHVIYLKNDRGASYQVYLKIQEELMDAYNELRDELAMQKWQVPYSALKASQQNAIREIYPVHIYEVATIRTEERSNNGKVQ